MPKQLTDPDSRVLINTDPDYANQWKSKVGDANSLSAHTEQVTTDTNSIGLGDFTTHHGWVGTGQVNGFHNQQLKGCTAKYTLFQLQVLCIKSF